ncbi:glycine-rich cell wall structural protein 1.8 [Rhodamnia argentea]|uniref:Glycine-rich cell wall structural protein 1.8 n=1 Tax=Rhodamnia argentea TaxID=178133 RepID=A0ABM3GRX6_9MYRT|nr:glycine-rich cell wall structural protein 1.8 [Rhodamnia argentea]
MKRDLSPTSLRNGGGEHQDRPEDGAENPESKTFLNSLLSAIVPEKAPPATTADEAGGGHDDAADGGREVGEESGGGGGGIIGHLISDLVSPGSPEAGQSSGKRKAGGLDVEDGGRGGELGGISRPRSDGESEAGGGGGGGGVMSSLLSSFFHSSEEGGGADAAAGDVEIEGHRATEGGEKTAAKSEAEEVGGGGIIENIVSHLPPSILEVASPTTDEASILIHSIVRD